MPQHSKSQHSKSQYSKSQYSKSQYSKSQYSEPQYRSVVYVDIARFTDERRTFLDQTAMHRSLSELLEQAFDESDVAWQQCDWEDRGDGKLILVPPDVPRIRLADQLWNRLLAGLRRHNAVHTDAAAIQLRVALHSGDVRESPDGKVGPAINLAARLVNAEDAKQDLARHKSELALIASAEFFRDVIEPDHAAEPSAFRRIGVAVKETRTTAWLRVSGVTLGRECLPEMSPEQDEVLELLPRDDLNLLQTMLEDQVVPQLPTLRRRAVELGMPTAQPDTGAEDILRYMSGLNAGPGGVPPLFAFVELLAWQLTDPDLRCRLRAWVDEQAERLRLDGELAQLRAGITGPVDTDVRLHLMIVIQYAGLDPDRFVVSYWRQDDPDEWPPPRGELRTAGRHELERTIEDLVIAAEQAWRGHEGSVAVEVVLPRAELNLPVHLWQKDSDSPSPRPLCLDYPVVVRSLERMRATHWHRGWNRRWRFLRNDPCRAEIRYAAAVAAGGPLALGAALESDPRCAVLVLSSAPGPDLRSGDQLMSALQSGIPAALWHRSGTNPDCLRDIVGRLTEDGGLCDLPGRTLAVRRDVYLHASPTDAGQDDVQELVLLWDDPERVLGPDELAG